MTDAYQETVQRLTRENNELKNSLYYFQQNLKEMLELRKDINKKHINEASINNGDNKLIINNNTKDLINLDYDLNKSKINNVIENNLYKFKNLIENVDDKDILQTSKQLNSNIKNINHEHGNRTYLESLMHDYKDMINHQ